MSEEAAVNANLTFDDVAQALGETDPNSTNAAKIRVVLGRGGLTTIQRHLDAIRTARAAALVPVDDVKVPAMPDSVAAMWGAAYGTAMAMVRTRMDTVVQERDALATALSTTRADVDSLTHEVEAITHAVTVADGDLEAAKTALATVMDSASADATAAAAELAAVRSELAKVQADAAHAQALAQRDAQLSAAAMQTTIDRLTDQVGELKGLLHKQASDAHKS